jgi:hypothetical protein
MAKRRSLWTETWATNPGSRDGCNPAVHACCWCVSRSSSYHPFEILTRLTAIGLRIREGCTKLRHPKERCTVCGPLWRQVRHCRVLLGTHERGADAPRQVRYAGNETFAVCRKGVSSGTLTKGLRGVLVGVGVSAAESKRYTLTSLRRGMLTALACHTGLDEKLRMDFAGHRSVLANRMYVDENEERRGRPNALLQSDRVRRARARR